ncbi:MAG: heparinase II/III family protein [Leeuwenhoekiella sp.]
MAKINAVRNKLFIYPVFFLLLLAARLSAQNLERPIILVKSQEREKIIQKIEAHEWAQDIYDNLLQDIDSKLEEYLSNPEDYLKQLPFNWSKKEENKFPPFYLTVHIENGVHKNLDNATKEEYMPAEKLERQLEIALGCGMAYFISNDERYADLATSVLYSFVKSVQQSELSDWHGRGGWLFPDDGFREVRVIGEKVPLIYDFIAKYIEMGGLPYDIVKNTRVDFPVDEAQQVFRTYADLTVNYGHTGSNHPVLEAPSLVYNALAMNDAKERERLLSYFLTESTKNQDALDVMAASYVNEGDIWPETSQYFDGVSTRLARLMLIVNRYDPSLKLGKKYKNVLYSLPKLDYLTYPNGEIIRWGDGHRRGSPSYSSYENAYQLGKIDGVEKLTQKFGSLINRAFKEGKYTRNGMESIFWYDDLIEGSPEEFKLSRTDRVFHAGIVLQRNESSTKRPEDGLMCFVGGAGMVHGHAEGMNIELYGEGQVLGVDNGRGRYQQDVHENYSRIYAGHNTIIVNGSSQGEGGWVNQGINTVETISLEPALNDQPISPYHSFSQTGFIDDKGDLAEAVQERTLGLVRTSPTSGYYVDVFRSKSKLKDEYHDYLYHNIGDKLIFENEDLQLTADSGRYMDNANNEWKQNQTYRHPGWHFFKEVETSRTYAKGVKAVFHVDSLPGKSIYMGVHLPGFQNREYTKVMAPKTFEAPSPYNNLPTPTLVVRNKGSAWENPFVAVYEPYDEVEGNGSIQSVEKIEQDGVYKGLKIISKLNDNFIYQYVITQSKDDIFKSSKLEIAFEGTFAVITLDESEGLQSIYVGEGKSLNFRGIEIPIAQQKFYAEY